MLCNNNFSREDIRTNISFIISSSLSVRVKRTGNQPRRRPLNTNTEPSLLAPCLISSTIMPCQSTMTKKYVNHIQLTDVVLSVGLQRIWALGRNVKKKEKGCEQTAISLIFRPDRLILRFYMPQRHTAGLCLMSSALIIKTALISYQDSFFTLCLYSTSSNQTF